MKINDWKFEVCEFETPSVQEIFQNVNTQLKFSAIKNVGWTSIHFYLKNRNQRHLLIENKNNVVK